MAFIESPSFPINISFGSSGGPAFQTDVVTFGNGVEYRNSRWNKPLSRFDIRYAMRSRVDIQNVIDFFMSRRGKFEGFRVKDQFDYTSNNDGITSPTDTDQFLGTADGVLTDFQLIKTYEKGGESTSRDITKPVVGTVVVAVNGLPQSLGGDYNLDTTTGIISFITPPASGSITAGFEFDIPCRFDTDSLADLEFIFKSTNSEIDVLSLPSIPLVEVRN